MKTATELTTGPGRGHEDHRPGTALSSGKAEARKIGVPFVAALRIRAHPDPTLAQFDMQRWILTPQTSNACTVPRLLIDRHRALEAPVYTGVRNSDGVQQPGRTAQFKADVARELC